MPRKKNPLPKTARAFFRSRGHNHRQERVIRNFHAWLCKETLTLSDLVPEHIEAYLRQPVRRVIRKSSRKSLYTRLKPYLLWLHEQKHLRFEPEGLGRRKLGIPNPASAFVDTLRPVLKPATCHEYGCHLRAFHAWMDRESLSLHDIARDQAVKWLQHLVRHGLSPATRCHHIFHVRAYFEWLCENKVISADPGELLRLSDIPKKPDYLPRPFPPHVDRTLKRRFNESDDIHLKALLLMRCTGLRIGELIRLVPHCLETDHLDNAFLKVPLGKLNNERLVPLDASTRELLENLRSRCPRNAYFLLVSDKCRSSLQNRLANALKNAARDLDTHGRVTTHRLRHTYATELLNAGMTLYGIMRLLGHRSIHMTMRYAALSQDTVARDYQAAMTKVETRYDIASSPSTDTDPDRLLRDVIAWLRKHHAANPETKRATDAIIKRIHRIRQDIPSVAADIGRSKAEYS